MNKWIWAVVVLIILIIGVWYFMAPAAEAPTMTDTTDQEGTDLGSYAYECDEHVMFTMTPSSDMSSIAIAPVSGAVYPNAVTLNQVEASSGVRYEGGAYVFVGRGESVTLTDNGQSLNCSPVASADMAPFNFGD